MSGAIPRFALGASWGGCYRAPIMHSRLYMALTHLWPSVRGWCRTGAEQPAFAWRLLGTRLRFFLTRRPPRGLQDPQGFPIDSERVLISYWTLIVEREMRDAEWAAPFAAHPAPVALDVGANAGVFSHLLTTLNPRATVHAFEPLPAMARHIADWAGHLGRDVRVTNAAVGDRAATATLYASAPNDSGASLVATPGAATPGIEVPVVTLDDAAPAGDILLIKVDTEHYELQVLRGATRVLARTRFLILEVHRADELDAIRAHLGANWRCRRLTAADYLFSRVA